MRKDIFNTRILALILLVAVALVPMFSRTVASAASVDRYKNYDLSNPNSNSNISLDVEYFVNLLGGTGSIGDIEREYLKEAYSYINVKYDEPTADKFDITAVDGKVTVTAYPYTYTASNGVTVVWNPVSVTLSDTKETKSLVGVGGVYKADISGVNVTETSGVVVEYVMDRSFEIDKDDLNSAFNYTYNEAEKIKADYLAAEAEYNALQSEYAKKLAEYEAWLNRTDADKIAEKEAYEKYLDELAVYQEKLVEYNSYLTKLAAYQEKVDAYNAYLVALEEYNKYNSYKTEYTALLDKYNLDVLAYGKYTAKMEKIRAQLSVFETGLFEHVTYLERDLYSCIMGDTVNSVLSREDEIVAGVPSAKSAIKDAGDATNVLQSILREYVDIESEADKYRFYIQNYTDIKNNIILLAQTLYDLYRYDIVRTGVHTGVEGSGGKTDKYVIMVSQLILFANAISDEPVYSYPESKHAKIVLNKSTTIEYLSGELLPYKKITKTVLEILENNEYVKDTNSATPVEGGYPQYMEEPVAPIHPDDMPVVEKPNKPVKKPGSAPTPVEEPVKPEEVPNPDEYVVEEPVAPKKPAILDDAHSKAVIAALNNGTIVKRNEITSNYFHTPKVQLTKNIINEDNVTVTFYGNDSSTVLYKLIVLRNSSVSFGGATPTKPSTDTEDYTFKGWVDADGKAVNLYSVNEDISLYPSYSVTEYVVVKFFDTDKTELYSVRVKKGSSASYSGRTPTKIGDDAVYTFDKWVDDNGNAVDLSKVDSSISLYPHFTSINYIYVKFFDVDRTTLLYTHKILPNETASFKGNNPTKESTAEEDYTFAGWADANGVVQNLLSVSSSLDLYPVFNVTKFVNITFYDVNGNKLEEYRVIPGASVQFKGNAPLKENSELVDYTFSGWTNNEGVTFAKGAQIKSNVSLSLYPTFAETHYVKVNFYNANGELITSEKVLKGSSVVYSGDIPEKTGDDAVYTFDKWVDIGGNAVNLASVSSSVDLYPSFSAVYYIYVTFYADDKTTPLHTVKLLPGQSAKYEGNNPIKASTDKEDYTFAGWVDENGEAPNLTYVTKSLDLYPKFTVTSYVLVKFYDSKGSLIETHRVIPGTPVTFNGEIPTKDSIDEADYVFSSWKDQNGNSYALSNPRSDVDLYPEFTEIPYIVIYFYDTDGESLIAKKRVRPGTSVVFDGKNPEKAPEPEIGYTFVGWQTEDGKAFDLSAPATSAKLYPVFEETEYIVLNFYSADGTHLLYARVLKGQAYSYAGEVPTKESDGNVEYEFSYWMDADGLKYDLATAGYSAELYPVFREVRYVNINFYDTDGTLLYTEEHVRVGADIPFNGDLPTKECEPEADYTFAAWMDGDGVRHLAVPDADAEIDLYPSFDVTRYVIIRFFAADNTTVLYEERVLPGTVVTFRGANPDKSSTDLEDYAFAGWMLEDGSSTNASLWSDISLNVYPVYTVIEYVRVNFYNYDGGKLLDTVRVRIGNEAVYGKEIPTRPNTDLINYAFSAWVDENGVVVDLSSVNASIDLYPAFSETHFVRVNFYDTDGSFITSVKVEKGSAVSHSVKNPTKTGDDAVYTFEKWVDENGADYDFSNANSSVNLYPCFSAIYYIYVNFYSENKTDILDTVKILPGQSVLYDKIPVKESTAEIDDDFAGWVDAEGRSYDFTSVTESLDLYPEFNATYYAVVKFYDNNKQLVEEFRVLVGADIAFGYVPVKPEDYYGIYSFSHWATADGEAFSLENVGVSADLYPVFNIRPYLDVIFYAFDRVTVLYSDRVLLGSSVEYRGETPERAIDEDGRYSFSHWINANGEAYDFTYVGESVELYPEFNLTPYIVITFVGADGVTVLDVQKIFPGEGSVTYAGSTPLKDSIPEADYTFSGVWLDQNGDVFDLLDPESSATVYPDFFVTEYIIINFYACDGVTPLASLRQRPGQKVVYSGSTPIKDATDLAVYDFAGWAYADGTAYNFESLSASADLYPVFRETPYVTITFFGVDRVSALYTVKILQGDSVVYAGDLPTKESDLTYAYTFAYWAYADGSEYDFSSAATVSVYPVFISTPFVTVTFFDLDGVTVLDTQRILSGTEVVFAGILPTRESDLVYDYFFDAWVDKDGVKVDLSAISEDVKLYATLKSVLNNDYTLDVDETTGLKQYNVDLGNVELSDIPLGEFIEYAADNRSVLNITASGVSVRFAYTQVSAMFKAEVASITVSFAPIGNMARANSAFFRARSASDNGYVCYFVLKDKDGNALDALATATITVDCEDADKAELYTISYINADGKEVEVSKQVDGSIISFNGQSNVEYTFRIKHDVNVSPDLPLGIEISADSAACGELVTVTLTESVPLGTILTLYYYDADSVKHIIENYSFVMPDGYVLVGMELSDILYTVTFMSDGVILSQEQYKYGETIVVPRDPVKQTDGIYIYTFDGWSQEITEVTGDVTYEAKFISELIPEEEERKYIDVIRDVFAAHKDLIMKVLIVLVILIFVTAVALLFITSDKMSLIWKV